jgi:Zn-dependent protease
MDLNLIQKIAVWVLPVLLAITLHEAAHGFVAYRLGDPTAKLLGRVTVNPMKHIDPIGTIAVPLLMGIMTQFTMLFGWAKPVPYTVENFKKPERDAAFVAAAGPLANLLMAFIWAGLYKLSIVLGAPLHQGALFLLLTSQAGILINIILMILNLLPVPPLDGSKVVSPLLPKKYRYYYLKMEPYGLFILILLLISGALGAIIRPIFTFFIQIFSQILGL